MNDEQQFFDGFMDKAVELFASEVPAYFARGNHETRGPFSVYFPDYFPTPTGKLYYSFRQGPVHFIVLDCGEDKPDSDIEYSGLAQFDAYRTEQQEWLKKEIQKEEFKSAPHKVVVIHIPPVGSDWHGPLDIRRKILPVLKNQGITAMISGHTHRYQYIEPQSEEFDFPIIINAHTTSLEVDATSEKMTVIRKDTEGKELNRFNFWVNWWFSQINFIILAQIQFKNEGKILSFEPSGFIQVPVWMPHFLRLKLFPQINLLPFQFIIDF